MHTPYSTNVLDLHGVDGAVERNVLCFGNIVIHLS